MQPLQGIKIIDLTRAVSGPFCTMNLSDLGAQVIKIEPPEGDESRTWGPYVNGESAFYMSINRGKKSMALNLKEKEAQDIVKELVKDADVIVENYRPGVIDRLGLSYDVLKEINPNLIFASISGFGQTGPFKDKPAYDMIVQSMGGIVSITGSAGGEPVRVGPSVSDLLAGLYTAFAIMTALYARTVTGVGQRIDMSMLDCLVSFLENAIARYFYSDKMPQPTGNRHSGIAPFQSYKVANGNFVICAANQRLWSKVCKVLGKEELENDERFSTNVKRVENTTELDKIFGPLFATKTGEEWLEIFENEGVPCTMINNIGQVVANPQILAREMIIEMEHPIAQKIKMAGIPIKLLGTPAKITTPPPYLGQHTDSILSEILGMDKENIEKLKAAGVAK